MNELTKIERLQASLSILGIPMAYGFFRERQTPPYVIYIGNGQDTFGADNTWYSRENRYQLEYYFSKKNEATETAIENILLESGYNNYTKSEDTFIESEGVFVIYYQI